jgi:hypothetical protein
MRRVTDDEACGRSLEGGFLDARSGSAKDMSGCAVPSQRTPASCARWHACTVALRESGKPGEMGNGNFGFAGVKKGLLATVGLIGVRLRPLATDWLAEGAGRGGAVRVPRSGPSQSLRPGHPTQSVRRVAVACMSRRSAPTNSPICNPPHRPAPSTLTTRQDRGIRATELSLSHPLIRSLKRGLAEILRRFAVPSRIP